jgi:hypothetical protein
MAAPLNTCTTIEQRGFVRYLWTKNMDAAKDAGVVRFLWAKHMDAAKDIHKEMLSIWAAFLCRYPLQHPYFFPKNAKRHPVLSWYMYSGAPPSFNSCYVCTAMRIPIIVRHNKTR